MPVFNNMLAGASGGAGAGGYAIERSLRFNSADSAYIQKNFSSASNRKTWTLSFWVKLCGTSGHLISAGNDAFQFELRSDGQYLIANTGCFGNTYSTAVFRDYSAWQHFVIEHDATNTYCKIYVNGSLQKTISASNADGSFNNNTAHNFNGRSTSLDSFTDFYLADVHFIDGQALTADDFGAPDDNGVWQPKEFDGAYTLPASGTVYSSQTITNENSGYPTAKMFDGQYGSSTSLNNSVIADQTNGTYSVYTFATPISYNSSVRIYADMDTRSTDPYIKANSTSVTGSTDGIGINGANKKWYTLLSGSGTLSTVSLNQHNGYVAAIYAVEVDGTVLVDGTAAQGANSFHLDFKDNSSNAALGTDTSGNSNTWTVNNLSLNKPAITVGTISSVGSGAALPIYAAWQYGGQSFNAPMTMTAEQSTGGMTFLDTSSQWVWLLDATIGDGTAVVSRSGGQENFQILGTDNGQNYTLITTLTGSQTYTLDKNFGYTYAAGRMSGSYGSGNIQQTITNGSSPVLSVPNTNNIGVGDIVQDPVKITAIDASNNTVTVNGGNWYGSDGSGTSGGSTVLSTTELTNGDNFVDSPTNGTQTDTGAGGEVVGNYCTLNPLKKANITTSNGNLDFTHSGSTGYWQVVFSTIGMSSGKYYCEFTCKDTDSVIGLAKDSHTIANDGYVGYDPNGWGYNGQNGNKIHDSSGSSYGNSYTSGDVIGIAFDADGGNLYFYKNGAVQNSGTAAYTGLTDGPYFFAFSLRDTGNTPSVNFGQRAFSHPVSGYKALNTASLPTPTIADGSKFFDTKLWTGNGSSQSIATSFSPDFAWIKARNAAYGNVLHDIVRGANAQLVSNLTVAESSNAQYLQSFDSTGFTVGNNNAYNENNKTYVGWAWDAGNGNNTYTVTVSGGKFYVDGVQQPTLTLSEGSTYKFDQSNSTNATHPLRFSLSNDGTHGGGTEYTTGVTTVGTPGSAGAYTQIVIASPAPTLYAYCTNHSGMGFQVNTSDTGGYTIPVGSLNSSVYDQSQTWSNSLTTPNNWYDAASNATAAFDGQLNTFAASLNASNTVTFSLSSGISYSQSVEVYCNFAGNINFNAGTSQAVSYEWKKIATGSGTFSSFAATPNSGTRANIAAVRVDGKILVDSGVSAPNVPSISSQVMANPSAGFSIVSYNTSDNYPTIGHGLNAEPELIIAKSKTDGNAPWAVYTKTGGLDNYLMLNSTAANSGLSGAWGTSAFTSSTFSAGWNDYYSNRDNMIAYCFAPVEGYSAMGSYQGNGSTDGPFVHTGFKPRWVVLKMTSATSHWTILDTTRSVYNVTNEPLYANLSNAEESNATDQAIDILSNGFKLRSSAGQVNQNGGTYIYIAFAENAFQANGGLAR